MFSWVFRLFVLHNLSKSPATPVHRIDPMHNLRSAGLSTAGCTINCHELSGKEDSVIGSLTGYSTVVYCGSALGSRLWGPTQHQLLRFLRGAARRSFKQQPSLREEGAASEDPFGLPGVINHDELAQSQLSSAAPKELTLSYQYHNGAHGFQFQTEVLVKFLASWTESRKSR